MVKKMAYAVYIRAKTDKRNIKRRGWLLYSRSGDYLGFAHDSPGGRQRLMQLYKDLVEMDMIQVTDSFFDDRFSDTEERIW